jgi:hypothetical protein
MEVTCRVDYKSCRRIGTLDMVNELVRLPPVHPLELD